MGKSDREKYIQGLAKGAYLYIHSAAIQLYVTPSTLFSSLQFDNKYIYLIFHLGRSPHNPPQLLDLDYLTPQTTKHVILSLELFKTGQITPQGGFAWWFCLVLYYLF